jgi:hypothetical protein
MSGYRIGIGRRAMDPRGEEEEEEEEEEENMGGEEEEEGEAGTIERNSSPPRSSTKVREGELAARALPSRRYRPRRKCRAQYLPSPTFAFATATVPKLF